MTKTRHEWRGWQLPLAAALAVWALASPLGAAPPGDSRWTLRGFALDMSISDPTLRFADTLLRVEGGSGFGVEIEYAWNRRLGIEGTALFADFDAELSAEAAHGTVRDRGEIAAESFNVGLNYHLTPDARADLSVGAFAGLSYFGDVIFFRGTEMEDKRVWDDDFGFGLKVAASVPLRRGGPWRLAAAVRYLFTTMEGEAAGHDQDVNPLVPSVGISYSF